MSTSLNDLPWNTSPQVEQIVQAFNNNHAVLLNGTRGIGKSHLASMLMDSLFADTSSAEKKLLDAGTHPDVHVLTSAHAYQHIDSHLQKLCLRYLDSEAIEKKRLSRQIGVNNVRALVESMNAASSTGGCKLTIIYPVEHLNINSANAILKFLEEPTARTYLILISHDISKLTATIRSRCMHINIGLPDLKLSTNWLISKYPGISENQIAEMLELAGRRPLLAATYLDGNQQTLVLELEQDLSMIAANHAENTLSIARKWTQHKQTDFILSWICQFFTHLIKIKLHNSDKNPNLVNRQQMQEISQSFTSENLFEIYDYLKSIKQKYDGIVDETLLIEDVLQTIANNRI